VNDLVVCMEYVSRVSEYFVLGVGREFGAIGREFGKSVCARERDKLVALVWVPLVREVVVPPVEC
jgi:hypothetical protein